MAEVENWVDARGYIRNKPLTARVQCPRCKGQGELDAKSYPHGWPIKIICPECRGHGWFYGKVFVKKLQGGSN